MREISENFFILLQIESYVEIDRMAEIMKERKLPKESEELLEEMKNLIWKGIFLVENILKEKSSTVGKEVINQKEAIETAWNEKHWVRLGDLLAFCHVRFLKIINEIDITEEKKTRRERKY